MPAGIVFGFLGPNGAGKTTTIHLLLGLLEPTTGQARVLGFDTRTQAEAIRARSGALLEFAGLYERMSAQDNLDFYGRIYQMPAPARRARIKELLTHLDLWDRRRDLVSTWSRGMKQKLAVARALFHHPPLVFLDEPTAGFDPLAAAALRDDLASLVAREGVTVFLNTHNLTEAEKLCAQVGVIRQGKLVTVGAPDELRCQDGRPAGRDRGAWLHRADAGHAPRAARGRPCRPAQQPSPPGTARREQDGPAREFAGPCGRRGGGSAPGQGQPGRRVFDLDGGRTEMNDIWTMMWKESKDLLFQGGWKASIRPLLLIGIMGIYLPLQFGFQWLALSPIELFVILWIPFSVIISFIGDAIAGERERHTLETLLASRISDRAILLGKVVVTVGYAWGMALGGLLLGLILVNLFRGNGGGWMFYHPLDLVLEALALSLLTCILGASAGVLVSLRTSTVRQAQQILSIGTLVLVFGGVFALQALPANFVASLTYSQFLLLVMAVFAVLDAILLGVSLVSFRRSRLILS